MLPLAIAVALAFVAEGPASRIEGQERLAALLAEGASPESLADAPKTFRQLHVDRRQQRVPGTHLADLERHPDGLATDRAIRPGEFHAVVAGALDVGRHQPSLEVDQAPRS